LGDRLEMDDNDKKLFECLITQFVKSSGKHGEETQMKHQLADMIDGKGDSLIFLLYGPPGTGKTMTVEWIAEKTREFTKLSAREDTYGCQNALYFRSLPLNLVR